MSRFTSEGLKDVTLSRVIPDVVSNLEAAQHRSQPSSAGGVMSRCGTRQFRCFRPDDSALGSYLTNSGPEVPFWEVADLLDV